MQNTLRDRLVVCIDDTDDGPGLASIIKVGRNKAYELVRAGLIRHVKTGRTIKIPVDAIEAFLEGRT